MLNIKDPEAHRLAKELADAEQTTMTSAVIDALRAALAEHGRKRQMKREIMFGLIAAGRNRPSLTDGDPFADLYDEQTGLPR